MATRSEDEQLRKQLNKRLSSLAQQHENIGQEMLLIKDLLSKIESPEGSTEPITLREKALKAVCDFIEENKTDRVTTQELFEYMKNKNIEGFDKYNKLRATLSQESKIFGSKLACIGRGLYTIKK